MGAGASQEEVELSTPEPSRGSTSRSGAAGSLNSASASQRYQRTPPGSSTRREDSSTSKAVSRGPSRASSAVGSWKGVKTMTRVMSGITGKKFRAADKSNTVEITNLGFSIQSITINEGQIVLFTWNDQSGGPGFNVTQVVHDGDHFRPVEGGFCSGNVTRRGHFEQLFMLAGEYKFVSAGIRCTPLTVTVRDKVDYMAEVSDDGFQPKIIRILEGWSVKWKWSSCNFLHSVYEVKYCAKHCAMVKHDVPGENSVATPSGSYKREFRSPGLYYFETQGGDLGETHLCIVQVREAPREHQVEILDRTFSPMIMMIDEGDRVWWSWDKFKCKKTHNPYEIEQPPLNARTDQAYKAVRGGFRWPNPSKCGLMSHVFQKPGVYFFSDQNLQEAAEYIGTIIVRPKQKEHFVELSPEGYNPDLMFANTGDRIWWMWNMSDMAHPFNIVEIEKCLSPAGTSPSEPDCHNKCKHLSDYASKICSFVGLGTVQCNSIGVLHYRVSDSPHTFSVAVNPGPRNYTIHVSDQGFEPRVVTVHPSDRVWWVWQTGKKQHNIIQVSHQGVHIKNGFSSGAPRDCPSAFMNQFKTPGVYYYISSSLSDVFGAVIVASQPKTHEVQVSNSDILPDPINIAVNDVVCWTFKGLKTHEVQEVKSVDQMLDAQFNKQSVAPRRAMNRAFVTMGVHHFCSKSFAKSRKESANKLDAARLSSVLVDESADSAIVRVDSHGFHPKSINIQQGHSVLWTWKDSGEEEHNIIHVNPPNSDHTRYVGLDVSPLSVIQGSKSFNSGRPIAKNSFLYTFDELGTFCVASQGSPGFAGVVHVLIDPPKTSKPYITSEITHGTVERHHKVELAVNTLEASIYYTTDGTSPMPHTPSSKLYNSEKGIVLKDSGLCFVRAVAVSAGGLLSDVMTSRRFWVLSKEEDTSSESEPEGEIIQPDMRTNLLWHNCIPTIKGVFTGPGTMEIFWDKPDEDSFMLLKGYQVFFNAVAYCQVFPPEHNSVSVAGLAGGRTYEIVLEAYANDPMFLPHKSGALIMNCPKTTETGGPVISLEVTEQTDSMAVVWRSISTDAMPVDGYIVYLNGQQCGNKVVPSKDSNRCKVVIDGCRLDVIYKVLVAALPQGSGKPKMSNELEVSLPLERDHILLPEMQFRSSDEDLYREYIEVREGSGYVPPEERDQTEEEEEMNIMEDKPSELTPITEKSSPEASSVDVRPPEPEPLPARIKEPEEEVEAPSIHGGSVVHDDEMEQAAVVNVAIRDDAQPKSEKRKKPAPSRQPKPDPPSEIRKSKDPESAIVEVQDAADLSVENTDAEDEDREKPCLTTAASAAAVISTATVLANQEEYDFVLPPPKVKIEHQPLMGGDLVKWSLPADPDPQYQLQVYVVNIIGTKFGKNVNSDISYEILEDVEGEQVQAIQHCWNVTRGEQCFVTGLMNDTTYKIHVVADYVMITGQESTEYSSKSQVVVYETLTTLKASKIRILSVDFFQATLEWAPPPNLNTSLEVAGYQVYVDQKKLGGLLSKTTTRTTIDKLIPGKTIKVWVTSKTKQTGSESPASNIVYITCPVKPKPPVIFAQPSYKRGCVVLAWDRPSIEHIRSKEEDIAWYSIFSDNKWHGEIKANATSNKHGYQYYMTDLKPGQIFDVYVKAYAGQKQVNPHTGHAYCLVDSVESNAVSVLCAAPPKPPVLRIEGLHPEGVDITWDMPQQYGDATVSGFQLLKDGKNYGSMIPTDVHNLRIKDVSLGDKLTLQMRALTEHPVGRLERRGEGLLPSNDGDSGIDGSHNEDRDHYFGEKYSACKAGPKLVVHYTGLVQAPSRVWCEHVTGHSAMVVWSKGERPRAHYVSPDNYQVTWWPGDKPHGDINSQATKDDHLQITNLKPNTTYTVVVEARRTQNYTDLDPGTDADSVIDDLSGTFILTAQSNHLTLKTAQPPDPPSNLGVLQTTCHSVQIGWDPPTEHGVEVMGIRVDCVPSKSEGKLITVELMPDASSVQLEGLAEFTEYLITVTAITEEYFDQLPEKHKHKKLRRIPVDVHIEPNESPWLPNTSIVTTTSGTQAPSNVRVKYATGNSITVGWSSPKVHGTNRLQGIIVCWQEAKQAKEKKKDETLVSHVNLRPDETEVTVDDLQIGTQYKITIEAVVSVRTILNTQMSDHENRRTTHVMAKPLFARTKAPCEKPKLFVIGYTTTTIQLYWEKPLLYSVIGKDDGEPKYLKRWLEGYKLEINGKVHMRLNPSAQSVTLTKCKPGRSYKVVLVAVTCTEEVKRERNKKMPLQSGSSFSSTRAIDDMDLDESPSDTVDVAVPKIQEGNLSSISTFFDLKSSSDGDVQGDILLTWGVQGNWSKVRQFDIVWHCELDGVVHRKVMEQDVRKCSVPITKNKCVYHVAIEPRFDKDCLPVTLQTLQVLIPGSPDAPEIFTRSVRETEFVIEWGEPRLYGGVKLKGYQVYMNDRKVGNELSNCHRKAVIPSKPNRHYKINLQALSANFDYPDSGLSNTLFISTSLAPGSRLPPGLGSREGSMVQLDEWVSNADASTQDLVLKVTKVTNNSILLDWCNYVPLEGLVGYKVQWSSVAQPAPKEFRLSAKETSCLLQKCFPGTNHFIRLVALGNDSRILERSRQLTVQTAAPPEQCIVGLRACNFKYIAIQWDTPATFGPADITGYKVYVNGVVEGVLAPDQHSYSFTQGQWCREYAFQVQALTSDDSLHGKPSEPFMVVWPGLKAPLVQRVPSVSKNTLKVTWDAPYVTEGVKVKHYKVLLVEEDTERVSQAISPIHPDIREAEFHNMKQGTYKIYLEIHIYGTNDIVKSDPITVQPTIAPEPPQITVTVVGLEERRQIEKVTCDLLNKRDRLTKIVYNTNIMGKVSSAFKLKKDVANEAGSKTKESLQQCEDMLLDCFASLAHYSGHLVAHISWICPQSNPDLFVSGYKVMVDGKQYGSTLHSGMKNVRIKLALDQPSHRVCMLSVTNRPYTTSVESNVVELLTEPFNPFTYYCFHSTHCKGSKWPSQGACQYEDTFNAERRVPGRRIINQGLTNRRVPPPACNVLDVFGGSFKPLLPPGGPNGPTALLFWTKWCTASQKIMDLFVKFARENSRHYDFITIACEFDDKYTSREDLVHMINQNNWREDGSIWHCTSQCATPNTMANTAVRRSHSGKNIPMLPPEADPEGVDITEMFGILGVPTITIIHPDDYIAWQGRYCPFDYAAFDGMLKHAFSEVLMETCTVPACEICKNDMDINIEGLDLFQTKHDKSKVVRQSSQEGFNQALQTSGPMITTPIAPSSFASASRPLSAGNRPQSGGRSRPGSATRPTSASRQGDLFKAPASLGGKLFMRSGKSKHDRISVNSRPFSGSRSAGRVSSAKRNGSAKKKY